MALHKKIIKKPNILIVKKRKGRPKKNLPGLFREESKTENEKE